MQRLFLRGLQKCLTTLLARSPLLLQRNFGSTWRDPSRNYAPGLLQICKERSCRQDLAPAALGDERQVVGVALPGACLACNAWPHACSLMLDIISFVFTKLYCISLPLMAQSRQWPIRPGRRPAPKALPSFSRALAAVDKNVPASTDLSTGAPSPRGRGPRALPAQFLMTTGAALENTLTLAPAQGPHGDGQRRREDHSHGAPVEHRAGAQDLRDRGHPPEKATYANILLRKGGVK